MGKAFLIGALTAGLTSLLPLLFSVFTDGQVTPVEVSALVGAFLGGAGAYLKGLNTPVPTK